MPFEPIETPIPSPDAFGLESDAATLSAAAVLLVLGFQLRGDEQALLARAGEAAAPDERREPIVDPLPDEDLEPLRVPPLRPTGERTHPSDALSRLQEAGMSPDSGGLPRSAIRGVAERFHEDPSTATAAELFEACLSHPDQLTRVAAASSYLDLTTDPVRPLEVLRDGVASEDELTRDVAATSLARVMPEDPSLAPLRAPGESPEGGLPASTWMLVHGTWAQRELWWQPGGDFHQYFGTNVRPDLYAAPDRFSWSGGYSHAARLAGAAGLRAWAATHQLNNLELVTHSHGGSVAMVATQAGVDLDELVLLSCPVHIPRYLPRFAGVGRIVSVHVHMDLVVLADHGGQRFNLQQIEEHVLPIWFDHSATHDPDVWNRHGIAQWL
jgi:hypothetical protein